MVLICETPRLIVRQLEDDDFDPMLAICRDAQTMQYMGDGQPLTPQQVRRWIVVSKNNYVTKGYGCSGIIEKANQQFIGFVGLVYAPDSPQVELIYAIHPDYQGQGFATEAAQAMLAVGVQKFGLKRIIATVDENNILSQRVIEKVGMAFERRVPDDEDKNRFILHYVLSS